MKEVLISILENSRSNCTKSLHAVSETG